MMYNPAQERAERPRSRFGIAGRLIASFLAFAFIVLSLLWVSQITLLDYFYKEIKLYSITQSARTLADNIDNEDLYILAARLVRDDNVCVKVLFVGDSSSFDVSYSGDSCVLHRLSSEELFQLYANAVAEGGEHVEYYTRSGFRDKRYDRDKFRGNVPASDEGMSKSMIFTKIVTTSDGSDAIIMLNTAMYPVDATVDTLKFQLAIVTVIMLVLSLILAFVLTRTISKPIIAINRGAKELARSDYSISFDARGFREIEELSDTLNFATSELSKVDRLRNELIANISHDLRTPLTLIAGYGEVMRDIPGENTPENVQVIIEEAQRLSSLVSDILDISKLQSGTQTLSVTRFCLTDTVRSIITRFSKLVGQDGYSFVFEPQEEAWVSADELRVSQVIYNLVNNAITYTGSDKLITVTQSVSAGEVRLEVTDTGEGIEQEKLPYIWDRYYKVDKEHKRAAVGSGLGLSIVKGILDMHSARYGVRSEPGKGSTFWFALKASEEERI